MRTASHVENMGAQRRYIPRIGSAKECHHRVGFQGVTFQGDITALILEQCAFVYRLLLNGTCVCMSYVCFDVGIAVCEMKNREF